MSMGRVGLIPPPAIAPAPEPPRCRSTGIADYIYPEKELGTPKSHFVTVV
jgi:hypothetical protein